MRDPPDKAHPVRHPQRLGEASEFFLVGPGPDDKQFRIIQMSQRPDCNVLPFGFQHIAHRHHGLPRDPQISPDSLPVEGCKQRRIHAIAQHNNFLGRNTNINHTPSERIGHSDDGVSKLRGLQKLAAGGGEIGN